MKDLEETVRGQVPLLLQRYTSRCFTIRRTCSSAYFGGAEKNEDHVGDSTGIILGSDLSNTSYDSLLIFDMPEKSDILLTVAQSRLGKLMRLVKGSMTAYGFSTVLEKPKQPSWLKSPVSIDESGNQRLNTLDYRSTRRLAFPSKLKRQRTKPRLDLRP